MPITVYIHSNNGFVIEVPDGREEPLAGNNQQLSHKEFKAALQRLAELSMKFDARDSQPLSDYAMSRESIYENHPKL
ncbi:MAG: hypothetical protein OYL97_18555 [Candidatus Poribacteria bacterium]|nr:hypothetical protein [Candidatus Poribacteria bacterium]